MNMEENSLTRKITKQGQLIRQQINKFRRSFEAKDIHHHNFVPYLQAINSISDLNNSYGQDYYQFINKNQILNILTNNRLLMKDISSKLKSLAFFVDKQKTKDVKEETSGVCKICTMQIQQRNIQDAKAGVNQGVGLNSLRKMMKKFQEQNNAALFNPDEDRNFFKELNRVLMKKQEVLAITDNHLEKYLDDIMTNLKEIQHMQDVKDTTNFVMPKSINWQTTIRGQINSYLLESFKGKVPDWVQKTFAYFLKIQQKLTKKLKQTRGCQTQPYITDQTVALHKQITDLKQSERLDKSINQAYICEIAQLKETINMLQTQNSILKQRVSMKGYESDVRSARSSIVSTFTKGNSGLNRSKKQKNQLIQNSRTPRQSQLLMIQDDQQQQLLDEESDMVNARQNGQTNFREGISMTEHISSGPKRKKKKKINNNYSQAHRQSVSMNPLKETFLPNINKGSGNINGDEKRTNKLKKISTRSDKFMLSHFAVEKNGNGSSNMNNNNYDQKIQEQQNDQEGDYLNQNQIQEKIRQYKDRVSNVTSQLQNKAKHINILRKNNSTFDQRKHSLIMPKDNQNQPQLKNSIYQQARQRKSDIVMNQAQRLKWELNKSKHFNGKENRNSYMLNYRVDSSITKQNYQLVKQSASKRDDATVISDNQQLGGGGSKMHRNRNNKNNCNNNQPVVCSLCSENLQKNNKINNISNKVKGGLTQNSLNNNSNSISIQTQNSDVQFLKNVQNNSAFQNMDQSHLENIYRKIFMKKQESITKAQKPSVKKIKQSVHLKKIKKTEDLNNSKSDDQSILVTENCSYIPTKEEDLKTCQNSIIQSQLANKSKNIINNAQLSTTRQASKSIFNEQNVCLTQNSPRNMKKATIFTKQDFSLFVNEQTSFKYENNLKKKYHKTPIAQLSSQQLQYFTSVYSLIDMIKQHEHSSYHQIISFVKYPYQTVINDFSVMNIVKQMSLNSFLGYIARIKHYHAKCSGKKELKYICEHVKGFVDKIENVLVQCTYNKLGFEDQPKVEVVVDQQELKQNYKYKESQIKQSKFNVGNKQQLNGAMAVSTQAI